MSSLLRPSRLVLTALFFLCVPRVFAQAPVITAISAPRQVVTKGQSLTLSITATGATAYQWKRNGIAISGATAASYTITAAQPVRDNGWYQAVAVNASGSSASAAVFVLVRPVSTQVVAWGYGEYTQTAAMTSIDAVAIAAGYYNTTAVRAGGTLYSWGGFYVLPEGLTNLVAVATGHSSDTNTQFLALLADGSVAEWNGGGEAQYTIRSGLSGAVKVSVGHGHSLALKSDGTVVAWGSAENGATSVPAGLSGVVDIAAGKNYSLALRSDGTVVGWGANSVGQSTVPAALANVSAVAAGESHGLALKRDGTVVAWGYNEFGQATVPTDLAGVVAIAAGSQHSVALKSDGTFVGWGLNYSGQLSPPVGLNSIIQIEAGAVHTVALRDSSDDTVPIITAQPANVAAFKGQGVTLSVVASGGTSVLAYQWRKNSVPLAGATNPTLRFSRVAADDTGNFDVVVANQLGSITSQAAVLTANSTPAVSTNVTGRHLVTTGQSLNLVATAAIPGPISFQWLRNGLVIPGATNATFALAAATWRDAGTYQVLATNNVGPAASAPIFAVITQPTQFRVWGYNYNGELDVPASLSNVGAVAAGTYHTLVLKYDGTVVAWGRNDSGQCNVPAGLNNVVRVAGGDNYSMALRGDGSVTCWGRINYAPTGATDVVAIGAGDNYAMAVKVDGSVVAWTESNIASDIPSGLANVVSVSGGSGRRLALRSDGTVAAWGVNAPQIPVSLANVRSLDAEGYFAIKTDGTVVYLGAGSSTLPAGLTNVLAVSTRLASYAHKSDGTLAFSTGTFSGNPVPLTPSGLGNVIEVSVGTYHAVALRDVSGDVAPVITIQPSNRTAAVGSNATFSISATGAPQPEYQWQRQAAGSGSFSNLSDGGNTFFVKSASLSVTASSLAASGDQFRCVVANYLGNVTSTAATLTVTQAPAITSANSTTFTAGQAGSFTVTATGTPAPTFAFLGGIPGWVALNASTGVISGTPDTTASPFTLTIQASNSAGTTTQTFTLNVAPASGLANLSSLFFMTVAGANSTFTITGPGTKTVLIRGVGPTLSSFGVSGVLADPQLQLFTPTGVVLASNNDWGNSAQLAAAFAQVGAFSLAANSKDAALLIPLGAGTYTVSFSGVNATTGNAFLEIYDTGGSADTKLYYLSLKTFVSCGLTVGFVSADPPVS